MSLSLASKHQVDKLLQHLIKKVRDFIENWRRYSQNNKTNKQEQKLLSTPKLSYLIQYLSDFVRSKLKSNLLQLNKKYRLSEFDFIGYSLCNNKLKNNKIGEQKSTTKLSTTSQSKKQTSRARSQLSNAPIFIEKD